MDAPTRDRGDAASDATGVVRGIGAITLATHQMAAAVRFYRTLGFEVTGGGPSAEFTTLDAGAIKLNLAAVTEDVRWSWWGRIIVYVDDVDAMHRRLTARGVPASFPPRDAPWGERFFHLSDPDGHEVSLAAPLERARRG